MTARRNADERRAAAGWRLRSVGRSVAPGSVADLIGGARQELYGLLTNEGCVDGRFRAPRRVDDELHASLHEVFALALEGKFR